MKNRRLWILLAGIALAGAAFLSLDFRAAASSTQTEKLVMTTDLGEDLPAPMQQRDKISIVLVGEGPMVKALQEALAEKMDIAGLGQVELLRELGPAYPNPVLVVKVARPGPLWTPFFATSRFSVHAGYASDGDPTFMEAVEQTRTSVAKMDTANMYAEYEVSDRSLGLISRRGYQRFLAEALAQEIVTVLKGLYHIS